MQNLKFDKKEQVISGKDTTLSEIEVEIIKDDLRRLSNIRETNAADNKVKITEKLSCDQKNSLESYLNPDRYKEKNSINKIILERQPDRPKEKVRAPVGDIGKDDDFSEKMSFHNIGTGLVDIER